MWRVTLLAGAVLAMGFAFVGTTRAADEPAAPATPAAPCAAALEKKDLQFVRSANAGGEMEVALGKLAAEKASNADVKAFGQKMVDDHGKANEELGKLATSKGVDFTRGRENRQKKIDDKVAEMSKKTGADFDKAYVDDMVEDHEKDVKDFKKQAEVGKDEDVKKWAAQTLPTLEEHLKMIKDIQAKVKG